MGLSLVIPNGQSLIADYYEDLDRGKAFGALYLTGAVGAMIGAGRTCVIVDASRMSELQEGEVLSLCHLLEL